MKFSSKWDYRFLRLAETVSAWSKDPSTRVGAVIVDTNRRIVSHGYNGFARGVKDKPERYKNREIKLEMVVHAEANALLNSRGSVEGCILFSTFFPCPHCASLIVQSGIASVVTQENPSDVRYEERFKISREILREGGVNVFVYSQEDLRDIYLNGDV